MLLKCDICGSDMEMVEDSSTALCLVCGAYRVIEEVVSRETKAPAAESEAELLEKAKRIKPVDVFICCKETDNKGERTADSILAQELYYHVKSTGFRPFLSSIALDNKPKSERELYLDSALKTAKVMVVIGTTPANFNTEPVKGEWGRFIEYINNGEQKVLIPAYKDMSKDALPKEFAFFRSFDMKNKDFEKKLLECINVLIKGEPPKPEPEKTEPVKEEPAKEEFIEAFIEEVTAEEPIEFIDVEVTPEEEQPAFEQIEQQPQAADEVYSIPEEPADDVANNTDSGLPALSDDEKEVIYLNALDNARGFVPTPEAVSSLMLIRGYKDTEDLLERFDKAVKRRADNALNSDKPDFILSTLDYVKGFGAFAGADTFVPKLSSRYKQVKLVRSGKTDESSKIVNKLVVEEKGEIKRKTKGQIISEYYDALTDGGQAEKLREGDIKTIAAGAAAVTLVGIPYFIKNALTPQQKYSEAKRLFDMGDYNAAASIFENLGNFRDAMVQAPAVRYVQAECLLLDGDYEGAISIFENLRRYRDAFERVSEVKYLQANDLYNKKRYFDAATIFKDLKRYRDSKERALDSMYSYGLQLAAKKDYTAAGDVFRALRDYKDSRERAMAVRYAQAEHLLGVESGVNTEPEVAVVDVLPAEVLEESELAKNKEPEVPQEELLYARAEQSLKERDYYDALLTFKELGDYNDSKERIAKIMHELRSLMMISCGELHTVGLRASGSVAATGDNYFGQCYAGAWTDIVAVSAGRYHTVGITEKGSVIAAGHSAGGQCDVNKWWDIAAVSAGDRHTVGLYKNGTCIAVGSNSGGQCDVENWRNISVISAGSDHTVGLKDDGTCVATGIKSFGKCDVEGWKDIADISAGILHTVAVKKDGKVVAVGSNDSGQCDVGHLTEIVAVAAGDRHTAALKRDGTVVAVGSNDNGQCNVSEFKDIIAVAAGSMHTVGLRADGTVVAAGSNSYGECNVFDWNLTQLTHRAPSRLVKKPQ